MHTNDISYFAKTDYRQKRTPFGIKQADRFMHMYAIGKTGVGKSTMLYTLLMQDIHAGRGCCLIDPHGDLVWKVHKEIPEHRKKDVIYLNITDNNIPYRYNPLKQVSPEKYSLVASGILEVLKKLWHDAWGVKLEHILRFCIFTLLEQPDASFEDIPKLLLDDVFRTEALHHVTNKDVLLFWEKEYPRYTQSSILPVLNKMGAFLVHPMIRKVLIENKEELSLRKIMDSGKILLVNLAKGAIGSDVANVLGALLVTSIGSAAFSRVDMSEEQRNPFFTYVDEFHNFSTLSFVTMLSELRKFKLGMVLVHQYLQQLDTGVRHAVLGNIGTVISFRTGSDDARVMKNEMHPVFELEDFIGLPNYSMYIKLMIDGTPSKPFSAKSIQFADLSYE